MAERRRHDVDDAVNVAAECLTVAGRLIPVPDAEGIAAGRPPSTAESAPPWNASAAYAQTGLAETARRLEVSLLNQVDGHKPRPRRGCSDSGAQDALRSIALLAVRIESGDAQRAALILFRAAAETQRLRAVDQLTRWVSIRAVPGHRPPVCPYCKTYSLRRAENTVTVMCFGWVRDRETGTTTACLDADGKRPFGRLDFSRVNGNPVLAFNDGLVIGASG